MRFGTQSGIRLYADAALQGLSQEPAAGSPNSASAASELGSRLSFSGCDIFPISPMTGH